MKLEKGGGLYTDWESGETAQQDQLCRGTLKESANNNIDKGDNEGSKTRTLTA